MAVDIVIKTSSEKPIGSITFNRSPQTLTAFRTAIGFELKVPITWSLRSVQQDAPLPMISALHGKVLIEGPGGARLTVGQLNSDEWKSAGVSSEPSEFPQDTYLDWTGTFGDLAFVEKIREGKPPKLFMDLQGELCFLLLVNSQSAERHSSDHIRRQIGGSIRVRSAPERILCSNGPISIEYPRDIWIAMLRRLGIAENVLVEVPLPANPRNEWEGVWNALVDARMAFETGGTTGWRDCVTSVRVRWFLRHAANRGPHSDAGEWTRDDALLVLSTLSALLAQRNP